MCETCLTAKQTPYPVCTPLLSKVKLPPMTLGRATLNLTCAFVPLSLPQDGNGFIDRRELAIMMRHLGEPLTEEEITEILDEADTDADGVIDYTEFFGLMGRWTERKW